MLSTWIPRLHRRSNKYAYLHRRNTIKIGLAKLLTTRFIKEVFHPEWLANPVLVKKKENNKWRMCIDYTNINKHCPKNASGS